MQALQRGFDTVLEQAVLWGPRILLGVVILLVGWLVLKVLAKLVTNLAARIGIDRPFTRSADPGIAALLPSRIAGLAVFWLGMLFVVLTFLTTIQLDPVALPIQAILVRIGEWLPNLLAAATLALVGWLLATVARTMLLRLLEAVGLDERMARLGILSEAAAGQRQFSSVVGIVVYALVLLLFIVPAADALGLAIIAETAQNTIQIAANALPGILAAVLVMAVAALIAFVIRAPVTRLVAATGVDSWGRHVGLDPARGPGAATLSSVVGHVAFWLILLFAFPAALDRLGLEPIVAPLREAWSGVVAFLPRLAAAAGIGLGAVILARILGPLVERLLSGAGFDGILGRIGLARLQAGDAWLPSKIAGAVVALVIYLILGQEALRVLGLAYLAALVNQIILYLPNMVVAVVILALSLFIANMVSQLVRRSTAAMTEINSELAAGAAYVAIVVFGAAMAIGQLNVGDELVQRAVLLIVAALCLAAAIALGLGVRPLVEQWARSRFSHWVDKRPGGPPSA